MLWSEALRVDHIGQHCPVYEGLGPKLYGFLCQRAAGYIGGLAVSRLKTVVYE